MIKGEVIAWLLGVMFGLLMGWAAAGKQDSLPPCPGAVISAEYHKDGVMMCRYQQEPIGMKTYKQQVK